jgi:hypothetical protein
MADKKDELLKFAAQKASGDPFFLASALKVFQTIENPSGAELAEYLEISETDLVRLALCRRPYTEESSFRSGINEICTKFKLSPVNLINLLRRAEIYEQSSTPGSQLIAARDREENED